MLEIKSILIPVDASEISERVIEYGIETAKKFQANVTLLHVYELPVKSSMFNPEIQQKVETDIMESCKRVLDKASNNFENNGIRVEKILQKGHPGYRISEISIKNNFDLIIMGSRDIRCTGHMLLSSTGNYVIHHTNKPVMLIQ